MGGSKQDVARARLEDRELACMFQEVERFPEEARIAVKKLLDAFLMKKTFSELPDKAAR
jgi:hypothetical protein